MDIVVLLTLGMHENISSLWLLPWRRAEEKEQEDVWQQLPIWN
jgi:hypothetical protein